MTVVNITHSWVSQSSYNSVLTIFPAVFVLNHASPDDFQPLSLREMHSILATEFQRAKVTIGGSVSLAKSGLVPVGRGFPEKRPGDKFASEEVNFHLLPSNAHLTDSYGVYATSRPDRAGTYIPQLCVTLCLFCNRDESQSDCASANIV